MYTISQTFQFITHAGKTTQYEVLASGKPSFNRKSMINILSWTKVLGDITKKRRFYFKITKSLLLQVAHDLKCLIWEDHTSMGNTDHARTLYPRASAKKKVLSLLPFLSWHHTLNFWDLLILFFHAWTTQREEILHPFLLLVKKKKTQNCFFCKNSKDSSVPFMIFFATDIFQPQDSRAFQRLTSFKLYEGQQQQTPVFLSW